MLTISENAQKELDTFFSGRPDLNKTVRIYLTGGCCSGPSLAMALDDPKDNDVTETVSGILYCIEKDLAERTGSISLDLGYMGFLLMPEHPLSDPSQAGGCCSSCGGGCGTGSGCC